MRKSNKVKAEKEALLKQKEELAKQEADLLKQEEEAKLADEELIKTTKDEITALVESKGLDCGIYLTKGDVLEMINLFFNNPEMQFIKAEYMLYFKND